MLVFNCFILNVLNVSVATQVNKVTLRLVSESMCSMLFVCYVTAGNYLHLVHPVPVGSSTERAFYV